MKGYSKWSFKPYKPLIDTRGDIYICRIAPFKNKIIFNFLNDLGEEFSVYYKQCNQNDYTFYCKTNKTTCEIIGLLEDCDYCFYLEGNGKKSSVRLARTGASVGVTVNYLHPDDDYYAFSGKYLCSPSLIRTKEGCLLSSMDGYAKDYPQNLTLIFKSVDNGKTWEYVTELYPCFWGQLFNFNGDVYMIACTTEYGNLIISKSIDGGNSFLEPVTLLRGSNGKNGNDGVHKNPQPPVVFNGRIYFSLEWGSWANTDFCHAAMVASVKVTDDLLNAENWTFSKPKKFQPFVKEIAHLPLNAMTIEGTLVENDGNLFNVMRFSGDKQALCYKVNYNDNKAPLEFYSLINFPANLSKFTIKYNAETNAYYSIATINYNNSKPWARNYLALLKSYDLKEWKIVKDIYNYTNSSPEKIGFQYVSFEFSGDDIIFICRTAQNGANSYHNSNYQTFDVIKNFKIL